VNLIFFFCPTSLKFSTAAPMTSTKSASLRSSFSSPASNFPRSSTSVIRLLILSVLFSIRSRSRVWLPSEGWISRNKSTKPWMECTGARRSWTIMLLKSCLSSSRSSRICFSLSMERILARSSASIIGFEIKSSAPASRPLMRSSNSVRTVIMMTGMKRVFSLFLSSRQIAKPSMSGIMASSRIRSGFMDWIFSRACRPDKNL